MNGGVLHTAAFYFSGPRDLEILRHHGLTAKDLS